MSYSDPQSLTISGSAVSLPRVSAGAGSGAFQSSDGAVLLDVRNTYGKRIRRTARVTTKKFASDPLNPSQNIPVSGSFYVVADFPLQGIPVADQEALAASLAAWLTASTNANLKKLLGGEA